MLVGVRLGLCKVRMRYNSLHILSEICVNSIARCVAKLCLNSKALSLI